SACEHALADEHVGDGQCPAGLVEARVVRPRAAVDVVVERVAVAVEALDALELSRTGMRETVDADLLELTRPAEIQVRGGAGVVEDACDEQDAVSTRRAVRRAKARERIVPPFLPVIDRRAVENVRTAFAVELVPELAAN